MNADKTVQNPVLEKLLCSSRIGGAATLVSQSSAIRVDLLSVINSEGDAPVFSAGLSRGSLRL
jgi:hypothetical protein